MTTHHYTDSKGYNGAYEVPTFTDSELALLDTAYAGYMAVACGTSRHDIAGSDSAPYVAANTMVNAILSALGLTTEQVADVRQECAENGEPPSVSLNRLAAHAPACHAYRADTGTDHCICAYVGLTLTEADSNPGEDGFIWCEYLNTYHCEATGHPYGNHDACACEGCK